MKYLRFAFNLMSLKLQKKHTEVVLTIRFCANNTSLDIKTINLCENFFDANYLVMLPALVFFHRMIYFFLNHQK